MARPDSIVVRAILAGCVLGAAGAAHAQSELRPVDPGSASAGPLAGPGRLAPADLRAPSAFDRVYRVMNAGKQTGQLARTQGGLVATYSDSQSTGVGGAAVPAGTVFHIGAPREVIPASRPAPRSSAARPPQGRAPVAAPASTSAREMFRARAPAPTTMSAPRAAERAPQRATAPPSVFTDETYRNHLVASLLDRALEAPKG